MKPTTLIYCGEQDDEAAKVLAASLRDGTSHVHLCSASAFVGRAEMPCERVFFTEGVQMRLRAAITAAHGLTADEAPEAEPLPATIVVKRPRGRPRKAA